MVEIEGIEEVLKTLSKMGARGVIVLNKDGTPVASDLPEQINENTFSVMCATVIGASKTANSELDRKPLQKICIDSKDRRIFIMDAGRKLVLSVIVSSTVNTERAVEGISKAAEKIGEII